MNEELRAEALRVGFLSCMFEKGRFRFVQKPHDGLMLAQDHSIEISIDGPSAAAIGLAILRALPSQSIPEHPVYPEDINAS